MYSQEICKNWDLNKSVSVYENGCIEGLKCKFSHGWNESKYHYKLYKTLPCGNQNDC
jgi:hypothetical protein